MIEHNKKNDQKICVSHLCWRKNEPARKLNFKIASKQEWMSRAVAKPAREIVQNLSNGW